ncbi:MULTISPECIES: ATP-binding protein [Paenibacillus]|uniref:histidine kinase n=1 Tax=Paenibacillus glucanolyticus TaxID=59843 RepID=A0A163K017_9BACL|nr:MULTISPECIES: ATP-binding protein [Paenibacillus]ANA80889.1 PAS domain-containing sensor histidine kinase [Paenibacillus glucanolyticus]AWP29625.1 PAS domain-containing sensor histidine kinase [Paenibacillus sp. Cedars]ETT40601.1 multi-sensor signal transduction histidine kinase [Paenibacillus sp. FSL R5-808]KZS46907.1 PAS domain-containing sensor histidine kinase [Paenibacillus glucanolyticus]MDH6673321.1 PAS domain S-box-containing protein [Paenibacillus sp. LBL]
MLSLWKDILLQVLLSGTLIFHLPLLLDRHLKWLNKKNPNDLLRFHKHIVISSGVSTVLCVLISAMNEYYVPINLGVIPLFLGILYGSRSSGLCLAVLYMTSHGLINGWSMIDFILNVLVLVYSLLPWISSNFKKGSKTEKICWLWSALIPAMLIIVASHAIEGKVNNDHLNPDTILVTILYMLIGIFYSGMIVYWIELTSERLASGQYDVKSEEMISLTKIIEMIPLGMVAVDKRGNIIAFNQLLIRSCRSVFPNLTSKDVIGRPLFDLLDGMIQKEHLRNRFLKAMEGIESTGEIMRSPTRVYSTGIYPLIHNEKGDILGAVGVMEDITELEKLRTEFINVERLSLVGQMAASITHEIRNPMAVVRGFLQLMKEKSPETLDHYYRIVMEELDRANGIINDFLSLAQNRAAEKEDCHLHDIIHELSPLLWADANLRGQSIELKLGTHVPKLHLNAKEMKQLILNLCRNGMEAMDDKGTLTLETRIEGDQVQLYVADTGTGMSESELERLFEPFYTTKSKGTGLGLALCMSIVQRHHGTIDVKSQQGEGTVFIISFSVRSYPQGLMESQSAAASE